MTDGADNTSSATIGHSCDSWARVASQFIGNSFDLAKPCLEETCYGQDPLVHFASSQLFVDCQLSSESVLLLIRAQKEWDADLVTRAVLEGSLKLAYLLEGEAEEVKRKTHEYWNVLPSYHAIKRSDRAKQLLEALPNPESPEWKPLRDLILDEAKVGETRAQVSRKQRQALDDTWSFSGLCRSFAKSENSAWRQLAHLAYGYGMSSHLMHKDADGVGMVWERYGREPRRRGAVKLAHSARVVSDVCAFSQLRLVSLLRASGRGTHAAREVQDRYAPFFAELTTASRQFIDVEYDERGFPD